MNTTSYRFYRAALLAVLILAAHDLHAQDTTSLDRRASFGVFAGVGLNQHSGSFEQLPGVTNCGSIFTSGFGIGPDLGVFYKLPLADLLSLSLRGLYLSHGGTFNADEHIPLSVGGTLVQANDRHSLSASLGSLALQPVVDYELMPRLSVFGGFQISYLLSATYTQSEELTSPSTGVFYENRLRTRNAQAGAIPDVNKIGMAVLLGAGYSLPMNSSGSLHAVPQAYMAIGLTPVVNGVDWKTTSFNAGVAIEYMSPKQVPPPPPPPPPPPEPTPTPAAPPPVAANVRAYGLNDDGSETPGIAVVVQELYAKNMSPILPFVFFDSNSSEIPARMHALTPAEAKTFDVNKVATSNALRTHADMLNIIGSRLAAAPKARATLTGIIYGTTSPELVKKRAQHVRDYLTNVWGIENQRLTVLTAPSAVTNNSDSDILMEEHRVEIQSNDPSLLDPLTTIDTVRSAEPPSLRIYPSATNIARTASWHLDARQDGHTLAAWNASDSVLPRTIDWRFTGRSFPKYPGSVDVSLDVTDSLGRTVHSTARVALEQVTQGKEKNALIAGKSIKRYNLIVFDRGSSVLTSHHKRLNDQIRPDIKANSQVSVIGYTDRVGDAGYNQHLSEDRAQAVAKALGVSVNAQVKGIGETQDLYPNTLPEGRFFCRTVVVTIETQEKTP